MRKLAYLLPAVLLSGCSWMNQTIHGQDHHSSSCQTQSCAPSQSYSVSDYGQESHSHSDYSPTSQGHYGAYDQYQNQPYYAHENYTQNNHAQSIQTYDAQADYGYNNSGYVQEQPAHAAPAYQGGHASGAPHGLRGPQNRKPGHFYATLGGVLHDTDLNSYGLEGRIGYNTGRFLGAELEGSVGLIDEEDVVGTLTLDSGFDYNVAAFALARLPITESLSVHARGGYDFRKLSVSGTDTMGVTSDSSINLDGFAYGVGGEFALTPRDGLRVDYTRYDNEFGAADSVSASYVRKF